MTRKQVVMHRNCYLVNRRRGFAKELTQQGKPALALELVTPGVTEAGVVIEDFRIQYNTVRPHSKFGCRSPVHYAAQLS